MPTVHDFGGFKITMYFDDDNPPHFHIVTPNEEAKVRIDDLTIFRGSVKAAVRRRALAWAEANRALLWETWREYSE